MTVILQRIDVVTFLEGNRTYTLFKDRRINYERSKIIPAGFLSDLHVDLGDFQSLSRTNKGHRFMLVAVDVLSRRVFAAAIKSKKFIDVRDGFEQVFKQMPYLPQQIFSDRGMEFESGEVRQYFKEKGILKLKANASHIKASFAERMIRTIKDKLYRYFSEKNTTDWINVIGKITHSINSSICRSTGKKPNDMMKATLIKFGNNYMLPL